MLCDCLKIKEKDAELYRATCIGFQYAAEKNKDIAIAYTEKFQWVEDLINEKNIDKKELMKIMSASKKFVDKQEFDKFVAFFCYQTSLMIRQIDSMFNSTSKLDEHFAVFEAGGNSQLLNDSLRKPVFKIEGGV